MWKFRTNFKKGLLKNKINVPIWVKYLIGWESVRTHKMIEFNDYDNDGGDCYYLLCCAVLLFLLLFFFYYVQSGVGDPFLAKLS